MDGRQDRIILVEAFRLGTATRRVRGIKGQLGQEPLSALVASGVPVRGRGPLAIVPPAVSTEAPRRSPSRRTPVLRQSCATDRQTKPSWYTANAMPVADRGSASLRPDRLSTHTSSSRPRCAVSRSRPLAARGTPSAPPTFI